MGGAVDTEKDFNSASERLGEAEMRRVSRMEA